MAARGRPGRRRARRRGRRFAAPTAFDRRFAVETRTQPPPGSASRWATSVCASSAKPRPSGSSSHAGMPIPRAARFATFRARPSASVRVGAGTSASTSGNGGEQSRRRDLDDVGRRLVGHEDAAARQEDRDHEREPERGGADHPACSRTVLRRARARLHRVRSRPRPSRAPPSAFRSEPRATSHWRDPGCTRSGQTRPRRAPPAAPGAVRRSVSVAAFWLASWRCRAVSAPRLPFVSRSAPRLEASVSIEDVGLPRPLVQRLAALREHDPQPAGDLLGGDGAPPPVLGPAVVRPGAVEKHPHDEHEHERRRRSTSRSRCSRPPPG